MTDLIILEPLDPAVVFTPEGAQQLIEQISTAARSVVIDISTKAGRENCASVAYKVAQAKNHIDKVRKDRVADQKKALAAIDEQGRIIWDKLEALQKEIRQPLTEFENREKARVAAHEADLERVKSYANFDSLDSAKIAEMIKALEDTDISGREEFQAKFDSAKAETLWVMRTRLHARQQQEAEQAELARLRAEAAEREKREREERIAREAAEKARLEAERKLAAEVARVEAEAKAKADQAAREARAKEEAALRAAREAEAKVEAAERAQKEAEQRAKIAEQQKAEAERVRAGIAQRIEQSAKAARDRAAEIHRSIRDQIEFVIVQFGEIPRGTATEIVKAIAAGKIDHLRIEYS